MKDSDENTGSLPPADGRAARDVNELLLQDRKPLTWTAGKTS